MPKVHAFKLGDLFVEIVDVGRRTAMPLCVIDDGLMHVEHCGHPWLDDVVIHQIVFAGVAVGFLWGSPFHRL